jgi:hypothetical protein
LGSRISLVSVLDRKHSICSLIFAINQYRIASSRILPKFEWKALSYRCQDLNSTVTFTVRVLYCSLWIKFKACTTFQI